MTTIAINNTKYAPIAERIAALIPTVPAEPSILSANTYFWTPAQNASTRRRNEERNQQAVADYLQLLGFDVERNGDAVKGYHPDYKVRVVFSYSESCANVYKSLSVTRSGKNSNITAIRKVAKLEACK